MSDSHRENMSIAGKLYWARRRAGNASLVPEVISIRPQETLAQRQSRLHVVWTTIEDSYDAFLRGLGFTNKPS